MQPLMTVDCQVVCFFLCSDENTNLNFVVFVCSQEWGERVARLHSPGERRIEGWLYVELWVSAPDIRLVDFRQVARSTSRLRVGVGVSHAHRHGLISVVNTHRSGVCRRNRFRTWEWNSTRTNNGVLHDEG